MPWTMIIPAITASETGHIRKKGADSLDGSRLEPLGDFELDGIAPLPWLEQGDEVALLALPMELA